MHDGSNAQSLLSWLSPNPQGITIRIPSIHDTPTDGDFPAPPFQITSEASPYGKLLAADFCTGNGKVLKKIFLFIQRDSYRLTPDSMRPITNPQIETLWQNSFSWHLSTSQPESFNVLSEQDDFAKRPIPFQSLFYCTAKSTFFHPPCPTCGNQLEQCYNDEILSDAGLRPYTSSLKRYLYCPFCQTSKGTSDFYSYEIDGDDPPTLRDHRRLIKDFAQIIGGEHPTTQLPCLSCQQSTECFGPENLVESRISPFAFYPFHMFIHAAMPLHLHDFMAMISGASKEEVEGNIISSGELGRLPHFKKSLAQHQERRPFFHQDHENHFGEILLLKLALLNKLMPFLGKQPHPDIGIQPEQFWINIADFDNLLPFLWNFKVQPIGLVNTADESLPESSTPNSEGPYLIALLWFNILLTNKEQSPTQIHQNIRAIFNEETLNDFDVFCRAMSAGNVSFLKPENIFWTPAQQKISDRWREFWQLAVKLGWSLLRSSYKFDLEWSPNVFLQELASLTTDVKNCLIQITPAEIHQTMESKEGRLDNQGAEDQAIVTILNRIQSRWQAQQSAVQETKPEDTDFLETQILNTAMHESHETPPTPPTPQDEVLETQILQAVQHPETPYASQPEENEDSERTVILNSNIDGSSPAAHKQPAITPTQQPPAPQSAAPEIESDNTDFLETQILSATTHERGEMPTPPSAPDDEVLETQILQTVNQPATPYSFQPDENEDSERTVILNQNINSAPVTDHNSPSTFQAEQQPSPDNSFANPDIQRGNTDAETQEDGLDLSETVIISPEELAKLRRR